MRSPLHERLVTIPVGNLMLIFTVASFFLMRFNLEKNHISISQIITRYDMLVAASAVVKVCEYFLLTFMKKKKLNKNDAISSKSQ